MSKAVELARHLETLNINNMYKNDFYWTWDKTNDEIDAIFTVADALRDLRERNKPTRIFDSGLGISIFRDNSTRTVSPMLPPATCWVWKSRYWMKRSARSPTAKPSAKLPIWSPSWQKPSASVTICSSAKATSTRRPLWMRWIFSRASAPPPEWWASSPMWSFWPRPFPPGLRSPREIVAAVHGFWGCNRIFREFSPVAN